MKCAGVQEVLRCQPDPSDELPNEVRRHLSECPTCTALREDLSVIVHGLRGLPPPEPPPGFMLNLRRELHRAAEGAAPGGFPAHPSPARRRRLIPLALAATLAGAIALGAGLWLHSGFDGVGHDGPVKYHVVHLSVAVVSAHPKALFEVILPRDIRVPHGAAESLTDGSTLRWRSSLQPGINEINIPLVGTRTGGTVTARLRVGTVTVEASAELDTKLATGGPGGLRPSSISPGIVLALHRADPAKLRGEL